MSKSPIEATDALRALLTDLRETFLRLAAQNGYGLYDPASHNQQIGRCSAFERAAQLVEAALAHAAPTPEPQEELAAREHLCQCGDIFDSLTAYVEHQAAVHNDTSCEPLDRATLLAAVERLRVFQVTVLSGLETIDTIARADVLRLLTGGTAPTRTERRFTYEHCHEHLDGHAPDSCRACYRRVGGTDERSGT